MKLPQFIPILTAFTARVAGRELAELLQSPTALARALADTQTVVGHDGVLCLFDPGLLASACIRKQDDVKTAVGSPGNSLTLPDEVLQKGPMATVLEAIQPLRHHLPDRSMIYATFAGPELLHHQLQDAFESCDMTGGADSDYVIDVIRDVVRSSLELKVDGIALIEQTVPGTPSDLQRCHKTVRKLADFYDAGFLVFRRSGAEDQDPGTSAHCEFDLASLDNHIGPVIGQPEQSCASNTPPVTTAGDILESTQVEELKTLLQKARAA